MSLIWKQKVGAGFQNWHVDLAKNGQTVYTICVNIGLLDIRADSGDINYLDVNEGAYAPDIDVDDEEAKESYVGDSKCKDDQASLGDKGFEKYTLYSVYGTNANGTMSALGFALLFGNEDKNS